VAHRGWRACDEIPFPHILSSHRGPSAHGLDPWGKPGPIVPWHEVGEVGKTSDSHGKSSAAETWVPAPAGTTEKTCFPCGGFLRGLSGVRPSEPAARRHCRPRSDIAHRSAGDAASCTIRTCTSAECSNGSSTMGSGISSSRPRRCAFTAPTQWRRHRAPSSASTMPRSWRAGSDCPRAEIADLTHSGGI
jgi:hypothetical protein